MNVTGIITRRLTRGRGRGRHAGRTALLVAVLLFPTPTVAQTLTGVVLEDGSRIPVREATIEIVANTGGRSHRATTDSLGAFRLHAARTGVFFLRLSHPSYSSIADTVTIGAEEEVQVELLVSGVAIPLQPLVVKARSEDPFGGFYTRAQGSGFGRFVLKEEIARRPGARTTDLLRGMAGIQVVRSQRAPGVFTSLISMRGIGPGGCLPLIYIDGMPVPQLPDSGVDDFIHPKMLEGVEIYRSMAGVPAQFQSLNACGVVAFWTRTDTRGPWNWRKVAIGAGAFLLGVLLARGL